MAASAPDEIKKCGDECLSHAFDLNAHLMRLKETSFTKAEVLSGQANAGIDFARYRQALANAEKLLLKNPLARFAYIATVERTLADAVDAFRVAFKRVEAFE